MMPIEPGHEHAAATRRPREGLERRAYPRLRLSYAIRVDHPGRRGAGLLAHTVTQDLSARGAYFCTPRLARLSVGTRVDVQVTVPHRIATDGREVTLDLTGGGRVVRIDDPGARGWRGEDGIAWSGVAVAFDGPLEIDPDWM